MTTRWTPDTLLNESSFLHAQEGYRPSRVTPIGEMTLQHWSERVATQPEVVSARELAGMSDEQLALLDAAFSSQPSPARQGWQSYSVPVGGGLVALGGFGLMLLQWIGGSPMEASPLMAVLLGAMLIVGLLVTGLGIVASFKNVPFNAAYGRVGLYVGKLTEQHPWLYKVLLLMRDPGAEAYRQRVLKERGSLRGVDYLMMREIAAVSEGMVLTQTARSVRERVQGVSGRVPALSKREALVDAGWASSSAAISVAASAAPRVQVADGASLVEKAPA